MQKMDSDKMSDEKIIEQMFKAGAHYGYSKTRRHPSVSKHIYATKNKTDLINLEQTMSMLEVACAFAKDLGARGKTILFVGTKPEAKGIVKKVAESVNAPYVSERWIGGTLSNFVEIKKRIDELANYQKNVAEGELNKYTKKERTVMAKKMERLARYYTGLLGLRKIPDALFIVDAKAEHIAATEAKGGDIPVISLSSSDVNIKNISYPIPGNDSGMPSIKFFTEKIAEAYESGLKENSPEPNLS